MGREATVTDKDVLNAKLELEAAGEKVTTRTVRANLGRGSTTTIARILEEMKQQGAQPEADIEIPEFILRALKAALLQQRQSIEVPLRDEIDALQQTFDDVLAESERRQEELEASEERNSALESSKADLNARLDEAKREAAEAEARHQQEMETIKKELDRYREESSALRIEVAQGALLIKDIPEIKAKIESLAGENKVLMERATNAERDLAAAQATLVSAKASTEHSSSELIELRKEIRTLSESLMECRLNSRGLEVRLEQSNQELLSLRSPVKAAESQQSVVTKKPKATRSEDQS
jgi:chromosome segregation ATPase